ncbi:hypothetical protein [Clostridium folliculivorans]|uniref:Uncharacterized protein n=1 Tax=Clostridium folliculivorans TaxID=2886038 RepID=A0A9W5Y1X4_9CLOT|nr:hypothetical protein [Clostridium folliculivorans]GKU25091.1 hypothetical protein CFOLD11_19170 [Clostridium folliculivorans]GKU31189.1 hypothetical protein CFB3_32960 [Clostridium folliculivorans]
MDRNTVFYDEVKDELKTGDLILFHGLLLSSQLNEIITRSQWSHVGMVVRPEDIGITKSDRLLLWESNILVNLPDVELKESKVGPMLVDLEARLITDVEDKKDNRFKIRYNGCEITEEMLEKLKTFVGKVHMDNFPESEFNLSKEFFEARILNEEITNDSYFCSELIADTFINMGLLTRRYAPNSYMPKDFSSDTVLPFIKKGQLIDGPLIDVVGQ